MSDDISSLMSIIGSLTDRIAALENASEDAGAQSEAAMLVPNFPTILEGDDGTVRGFVYPDAAGTVAVLPLTWWHPDGKVTSILTEGLGTPTKKYIIATRTASTLTISDTATIPTVADADTVRLLVTLTYDEDDNVSDIKRHNIGDIFPSSSSTYSFKFTKTSETAGTLIHGNVYVKGVPLTCSGWANHSTNADLSISGITTTTYFYWLVDLAAATAAWTTNTTGFPAVTATVYPWPILTLTCAGSVITAVKEHRDVHLPGNV